MAIVTIFDSDYIGIMQKLHKSYTILNNIGKQLSIITQSENEFSKVAELILNEALEISGLRALRSTEALIFRASFMHSSDFLAWLNSNHAITNNRKTIWGYDDVVKHLTSIRDILVKQFNLFDSIFNILGVDSCNPISSYSNIIADELADSCNYIIARIPGYNPGLTTVKQAFLSKSITNAEFISSITYLTQ